MRETDATWLKVALIAETLPDWPQKAGDEYKRVLEDSKQVGLLFPLQGNAGRPVF